MDTASRSRSTLVLGIVAAVLAVAVIVALVILFTRPSATPPSSDPTPSGHAPSASAPASPSPTPEVSEPTELVLGADGFTLVDDTGAEVFAYAWADDIAPAVAALTDAFGAEPSQRIEPGDGNHYPDYTVYTWEGLALFDMVPLADGKPRDEYSQPSYLRYTRNEVGPLAVTAEFGLAIGLPASEVEALSPGDSWERNGGTRYVFAPERSGYAGDSPTYSVVADTDGTAVTAILYYYYSDL